MKRTEKHKHRAFEYTYTHKHHKCYQINIQVCRTNKKSEMGENLSKEINKYIQMKRKRMFWLIVIQKVTKYCRINVLFVDWKYLFF